MWNRGFMVCTLLAIMGSAAASPTSCIEDGFEPRADFTTMEYWLTPPMARTTFTGDDQASFDGLPSRESGREDR